MLKYAATWLYLPWEKNTSYPWLELDILTFQNLILRDSRSPGSTCCLQMCRLLIYIVDTCTVARFISNAQLPYNLYAEEGWHLSFLSSFLICGAHWQKQVHFIRFHGHRMLIYAKHRTHVCVWITSSFLRSDIQFLLVLVDITY